MAEDNESWDIPLEEKTVVEVRTLGPLIVYGNIIIRDQYGSEIEKKSQTAFCRCGASTKKPFCDGNHKNVIFED